MRFPTGDHIPTPDQLSLTADPTALSVTGRDLSSVVSGHFASRHVSAYAMVSTLAIADKRWQELAWLRRGRSEASKRLTVSTFRRSTGHFATDESPSPTWGQDRCLSPLGPSWALSGPLSGTPFWDPLLGPHFGPLFGAPARPGGEICPPRARGQIWPFPVQIYIYLYYSGPPGPPVGGPPWGGRAAGGAKKCTFFWVFNNSPSRDNLKFFFPRDGFRDPPFWAPFWTPPGRVWLWGWVWYGVSAYVTRPCLSVPRPVGWNAWRDGTPTPNGAGGTCPHVTQPPPTQGTAVPRSEVSDRMMTAQRSERVIMAERPTERKTLKCPSARDPLLGKG